LGLVLAVFILLIPVLIVEAGHNHVWGELRVDNSEIYNAQAYQIIILAFDKPSNGYPNYTTGWIGLELDNQCTTNPVFGCAQFIQVGIITKTNGARWFVYAEPGVTCKRGNLAWGSYGCTGEVGDIVNIGVWTKVELRKYINYWEAVVYDTNSNPYVVATINTNHQRIYRAYVDMEESYATVEDPWMLAKFYYYNPKYSVDGNSFVDWPVSTGEIINGIRSDSYIDAGDDLGNEFFCPSIYSFRYPSLSNERYWYIGSPNPFPEICEGILLPSVHIFMPLMLR